MARCEQAGMRKDRIMMTERRKNRRTEERKAREDTLRDHEIQRRIKQEKRSILDQNFIKNRKKSFRKNVLKPSVHHKKKET